jgi:hypothetical protein
MRLDPYSLLRAADAAMSRQRLECHQARRTSMGWPTAPLQPRLEQCRGLMMILAAG